MIVITDDKSCADRFLEDSNISWERGVETENEALSPISARIFGNADLYRSITDIMDDWNYLLVASSAPESQYDILIDLARKGMSFPETLLCAAEKGLKFHGFKGRRWDSPEGNIYLSAHFTPRKPIANYGPGFMVLAAVSVIEAIDEIPGLSRRAGIKWVNDIMIDGAKISGVLAHTMAENDKITNAVIGIGLNVETTPNPEPTIFVPRAGSLNDFAPDRYLYTRSMVLRLLTKSIYKNYLALIDGHYRRILEKYRNRSEIVGRDVCIYEEYPPDKPAKIAEGTVNRIGDNLELYLDDSENPIKRGRLAYKT